MGKKLPPKLQLGVAAIIEDELGRVLLAKRDDEPMTGYWHLPGGGVKVGETLSDALKREIMEELGVEITIRDTDPVAVSEAIVKDARRPQHAVLLFYRCRITQGTPKPLDGTADIAFFTETGLTDHPGPFLEDNLRVLRRSLGWKIF